MRGRLVILTGASGGGKTTIAKAVQECCAPSCKVYFFDSIGVPSAEKMKAWGDGHQPGGAWQRAMTIRWIKEIASLLNTQSILFEGQMRIAFIREALSLAGLEDAHILLVDCEDGMREERLNHHRHQPKLANEHMMAWARYLRDEARTFQYDVLDTTQQPIEESARYVCSLFMSPPTLEG